MLLRFFVENYLSFKDETEFSMIAGQSQGLEDHIIPGKTKNDVDILRSSIIYGANASGKSNLVKAISFAKKLIISEFKTGQSIPVIPFKLCDECINRPSKFEFEFKINDKIYSYGFSCNSKMFIEEWLYEIGKTTEKMIFERKTNSDSKVEIKFNKSKIRNDDDKKRLEYMSEDTLPNQLFLTMTNKRNIKNIEYAKPLIDAYYWMDKCLTVIFPETRVAGLEFYLNEDQSFSKVFQGFLEIFDTGINGISQEIVDFDSLSVDIPQKIRNKIISDLEAGEKAIIANNINTRFAIFKDKESNIKSFKLMTKHKDDHDKDILFEVYEESDGTQRIMDLIPALIDVTKNPNVFVIDEIDRSLHPLLTHKLLELFFELSSKAKSQMILTTHETNLLDFNLVRRDEIWFVQKDKQGISKIYSLDQFKPRNDLKIQKGYLLGRFGAIPFVKKQIDFEW